IVAEHHPNPQDIKAIDIVLPGDLARVVDRRHMPDINVQYLVAGSLLDGDFSFAMAHDADRMKDPAVVALTDRTTLTPDREVSGVRTATVTITLTDGTELRRHVSAVRGTVDNPMSHDEVVTKVMDLMEPTLGRERAQQVVCTVSGLADVRKVSALSELLR